MIKKLAVGALALGIVAGLTGGTAYVAFAQADVIKARQDNRKEITRIGGREIRQIINDNGNLNELAVKADRLVELHKAFGANDLDRSSRV